VLAVLGTAGKVASGWYAARPVAFGVPGRLRAGTALVARGEFSVVIAALGAATADGPELGALAATFVLLTALAGPLAAKYSDAMAARLDRRRPETTRV
jgi:CPA2 family monovalent cation:H+ antiporter-2